MKIFRIIAVALLLSWMVLIFTLSAQNADTSSDTSGGVIIAVIKVFNPNFSELTDAEQDAMIASYQFFVRKAAHFTAYAVLGLFAFLSVVTYNKIPFKLRFFISALICLIYAASDEMHQLFVPGRSGEIRDVLLDFSGSVCALLIMTLFLKCSKYKNMLKAVTDLNSDVFTDMTPDTLVDAEKLNCELEELKKKNSELTARINELIKENGLLKAAVPSVEKNDESDNTVKNVKCDRNRNVGISPDMEYGAKAIGKVVISAANHCNALTGRADTDTKELINLILGKTEAAKAEILKIVECESGLEIKKEMINRELKSTEDYFMNIRAQI